MKFRPIKMKAPQYHSAEVYNHIKRAKKRKKYPQGEEIPYELKVLGWVFAVLIFFFLLDIVNR